MKIRVKGTRNKYIGNSCVFVPFVTDGNGMKEKNIEKKLVEEVKKMGGLALKFVSPGLNGVPDRLLLLPMGRISFVELKAPGKKMRPLQVKRKEQLESLGFSVYCIDGVDQIKPVLNEIINGMKKECH